MRAMANGSSHSRNKRSSRRNEFYPHHIQKKILSHSDVRWAERQESKVRTKRDSFSNQNYSPFQHRSEAGASSGKVPYIQKFEPRDKFRSQIDSACVFHNVSTRFSDGEEFGFGAEIGISTDKLHARGPMGLRELTSYQYRVRGDGQLKA